MRHAECEKLSALTSSLILIDLESMLLQVKTGFRSNSG